ncbi:glycosyltransferase family 39 protein [Streptomyces sioyaensis]|uniref:Glycosyltransferase family 39 protein n=1 Tax=Streptomyces sioyaensis TaxID=67364 RepID=A0A4Q1QTR8_9ACTN|nr:glycosyltransferase family 39 protein [Streptomyces sioyaensis]MBM4794558.1 glycosyltransferase family 39 protein [Streptomyces sioyaensis]RXS59543.1 glycosyltransferase family 39 protein [Streptomyces sioyaensis]
MTPHPPGTPPRPSSPSHPTPVTSPDPAPVTSAEPARPASREPASAPPATAPPVADPRWARPALLALLLVTAVLYLWSLSSSGYANQFYSAAVQAGSESWKAFFFGSSDAANSITVDKPPAALWPMALSVRLFGLSSWAILVPEALMGVATVGVLYAAVRRRFGAGAGLLAGGALAVTPVAALMFRFNNPDALLCLLMVCAIAAVLRALADGRTKWLVLAGVCFGLGFLTKTLQAWLILPALAAVYACCAPVGRRRRCGQLLLAGLAMVVSAGWWVAVVELWPASSRPYIGGSQHNSFLELTFGYNGLGRISGNETGSVGGGGRPGGGGGGGWGQTGITRLFSADMGGQISWLLPAALILLVAAVCVLWRARRAVAAEQAAQRAEFLVWGGALLMTFTIFSFMSGIFHQYYNIALAPYIAALVGMGAALLWRRGGRLAALVLAGTVAVTAGWSFVLLNRSPEWLPWLRWTVLVLGLLAAAGLPAAVGLPATARAGVLQRTAAPDGGAAAGRDRAPRGAAGRRIAVLAAGLGVATALAGPVAYTLDTVNTPKSGSIVTAGPSVRGAMGGPGGGFPGGAPGAGQGGPGLPPGAGGPVRGGKQGSRQGFPGGFGERRGMGGLLNGGKVSDRAKALVEKDAEHYTWAAAAIGSQNAASYQLATQKPVMAIGGFNGSDPSPTLAQFKREVADGKIHYFIAGGRGGPGGGKGGPGGSSGDSSKITAWVEKTFKKVTVGGATFYDLTREA